MDLAKEHGGAYGVGIFYAQSMLGVVNKNWRKCRKPMTSDNIYFNGKFKGVGTFDKKVTAAAVRDKTFFEVWVMIKKSLH